MADEDLVVEGLNVSAAKRRLDRASREWIGPEGNLIFDEALHMIAILQHYFGGTPQEEVTDEPN